MKKFFGYLVAVFVVLILLGSLIDDIEVEVSEEDYTGFQQEGTDSTEENTEEVWQEEAESSEELPESTQNNFAESQTQEQEITKVSVLQPCEAPRYKVAHPAVWRNYMNQRFKAKFRVLPQQACTAAHNREDMATPADFAHYNYWKEVYTNLYQHDAPLMLDIFEEFGRIGQEQKLNSADFAEMVVTYIQNIDYVLVHEGTCEQERTWGGFSESYHAEGNECLPGIRFAIQSPLEFMYNLKGDCDTRSVLAYAILSHYGYDVVVLGCEIHAVLGINMPASGRFAKFNGKKYYFWEVTAKNWQVGQIAADYQSRPWFIYLPSINNI